MMTYHAAHSEKSTGSFRSGVECDPRKLAGSPGKYIRLGGLPRGEDIKEYDLGRFSIATVDFPHVLLNQAIGELWVSYTVMVRRPRLAVSRGLTITQDLHAGFPLDGGPIPSCDFCQGSGSPLTVCWPPNIQNQYKASHNSLDARVECGDAIVDTTLCTGQPNAANIFTMSGDPVAGTTGPVGTGFAGARIQPCVITLPAAYSGDLEIKYQVVVGKGIGSLGYAGVRAEGNIIGISDMSCGKTNGSNMPTGAYPTSSNIAENRQSTCGIAAGNQICTNNSAPSPDPQYSTHMVFHVRVNQVSGGVDNKLFISLTAFQWPSAPNIAASGYFLSISEYNTGFTKKDSNLIDWVSTQSEEPILLPNPTTTPS